MEEDKNLQVGCLVQSTAGRDKGSIYLVLTRPDKNYMRLVDGNYKKLINPKLKKIKHVKSLNINLPKLQEKLYSNVKIFDSEIYSAIKKALNEAND